MEIKFVSPTDTYVGSYANLCNVLFDEYVIIFSNYSVFQNVTKRIDDAPALQETSTETSARDGIRTQELLRD